MGILLMKFIAILVASSLAALTGASRTDCPCVTAEQVAALQGGAAASLAAFGEGKALLQGAAQSLGDFAKLKQGLSSAAAKFDETISTLTPIVNSFASELNLGGLTCKDDFGTPTCNQAKLPEITQKIDAYGVQAAQLSAAVQGAACGDQCTADLTALADTLKQILCGVTALSAYTKACVAFLP